MLCTPFIVHGVVKPLHLFMVKLVKVKQNIVAIIRSIQCSDKKFSQIVNIGQRMEYAAYVNDISLNLQCSLTLPDQCTIVAYQCFEYNDWV